jgi:energy-converting hydrogenase A subunit R
VKETKRVFVTDCEGPISRNDNAFELTCQLIPKGERFFTQVSRYDDVLADIVKRKDYKAGDTLRLIVPFLKAYEVTNEEIMKFSARNILLMPGAKDALGFLKGVMPSFIVSTSYEHYIRALCRVLEFPFESTYSTPLDIDFYHMSKEERGQLRQFGKEIVAMPLIEVPEDARSLEDFPEKEQLTIERLDEIFWKKIMRMESGKMLAEINPVGGIEKTKATSDIVAKVGSDLDDVMYVGDSITDVECFRLVREGGGVTISFNGNPYAVREAEVAIISPNALVVAVFADVFNRLDRESVLNMTDDWEYKSLEKHGVELLLQKKLRTIFPETLPKASRITPRNIKKLSAESSRFRKNVRGEKVGRLG